ncbi:MAG TPA: hypothetical protein VJA21_24550 [Verrucomicrobiae bacterium]
MIARHLAACAVASILSFSACAQGSLETLVSDAKADWMFAKWQAETDNGDKVTLNVSWDLEKHVVVLHVKAGDTEAKGYTVIEPNAELPKYYSFDNRGSVGKGSWSMENGDLVLRVDTEVPDRGPRKTAFVFSGTSSTGLQVSMHNVESSGDLATPARMTLKFKKQS